MPDSDALSQDARLLVDAVRDGGALAMSFLRRDIRKWTKPDGSQVTEADLAINDLLADRLQAGAARLWLAVGGNARQQPSDWRASGCGSSIRSTAPATSSQGGSDWCVAVALVAHGQPIAAAVYRPVHDEFYAALQGGGASVNGKALAVADSIRPCRAPRIMGNRKSLGGLIERGHRRPQPGDAAPAASPRHVAAGRLDGAVSIGKRNDWDLAAGELLVREAGGRVTDTSGEGLRLQPARRHGSRDWLLQVRSATRRSCKP